MDTLRPIRQKTFRWKPEDFSHSMSVGRQTVSLPISTKLTAADAEDVIEVVKRCLAMSGLRHHVNLLTPAE
jgi:dTDP-4-amino-4,6-dideoxygalactose transaminase